VITSEIPLRRPDDLRWRYAASDRGVFTPDEAGRFLPRGTGDPRVDVDLAWELLYRLEPELYDRLVSVERLHPAILDWLPSGVERIVEVGAGTGRLTLELIERGREVLAIEPAAPLPIADRCADLVVACSALTAAPRHGGDAGLAEMERVCRPGGCVAIVWPNNLEWLAARGYRYESFPGEMQIEFDSDREAIELTEIFYPGAVAEVRRGGWRRVSYELLGVNPPRDIAFKVIAA
jgi:SAM-dependent methyltransferase